MKIIIRLQRLMHNYKFWCIFLSYCLFFTILLHMMNWGAIFTEPILQDDYTYHFIDAITSSHFLKTVGRIWGYTPDFSCGSLTGVILAIDNHWAIIFVLLLKPFFGAVFSYNLAILFSMLLPPVFLTFIVIRHNKYFGAAAWTTIFSMILVIGIPIRSFYFWGGYGFVLSCAWALYTSHHFALFIKTPSWKKTAVITILGGLGFWIHPYFVFILLPCAAALAIHFRNYLHSQVLGKAVIAILGALLPNLLWIIPFLKFWNIKINDGWVGFMTTTPSLFIETFLHNKTFALLIIISIWIIIRAYRQKKTSIILVVPAAVYIAIGFFGSQLGLTVLQPNRFVIPLLLWCTILIGISFSKDFIRREKILLVLILLLPLTAARVPFRFTMGYRENKTASELISKIRHIPPKEKGRLLFEDSHGHDYFGTHFVAYIPYACDMPVVNYPYVHPPDIYRATQFVDRTLFGKNLSEYQCSELDTLFKRYTISHIITHTRQSTAFFDTCTLVHKCVTIAQFNLYEVIDPDISFIISGSGQAQAVMDTITITNADSGYTVLSFHYLAGLKAVPDTLKVFPDNQGDAPLPFIAIKNGSCTNFKVINP